MGTFNMETANTKELKANVAALNKFMADNGMATKIGSKLPKAKMGAAFVEAIEEVNAAGKLDDVPEAVFAFYKEVAIPTGGTENTDNGATANDAGKDTATATDDATDKTPTPPKPKKKTRASEFMAMLRDGRLPAGGTRKEWAEIYHSEWNGTYNDAYFWTCAFTLLLTEAGLIEVNGNGKNTFIG